MLNLIFDSQFNEYTCISYVLINPINNFLHFCDFFAIIHFHNVLLQCYIANLKLRVKKEKLYGFLT